MDPKKMVAEKNLKESLYKEVSLMRELLANLFAETSCLLLKEETAVTHIMQSRNALIEELKYFRLERDEATKIITQESSIKLFLEEDSNICELPLLIDQLITLTDKINLQNAYNQDLAKQKKHLVAFSHSLPYAETKAPIRKNTLMTI